MILVDSSAWVEFLRQTGSVANRKLTSMLGRQQLAWTDMVALEVLAGARDDVDRDRLRRLIYSQTLLPVRGPTDYENAADLYRACRRGGETPRGLADCLIAAVAIRNGVDVLCSDADFQVIARHAPLRLAVV